MSLGAARAVGPQHSGLTLSGWERSPGTGVPVVTGRFKFSISGRRWRGTGITYRAVTLAEARAVGPQHSGLTLSGWGRSPGTGVPVLVVIGVTRG